MLTKIEWRRYYPILYKAVFNWVCTHVLTQGSKLLRWTQFHTYLHTDMCECVCYLATIVFFHIYSNTLQQFGSIFWFLIWWKQISWIYVYNIDTLASLVLISMFSVINNEHHKHICYDEIGISTCLDVDDDPCSLINAITEDGTRVTVWRGRYIFHFDLS